MVYSMDGMGIISNTLCACPEMADGHPFDGSSTAMGSIFQAKPRRCPASNRGTFLFFAHVEPQPYPLVGKSNSPVENGGKHPTTLWQFDIAIEHGHL